MRDWLREHAHSAASFAAVLVVAGAMAAAIPGDAAPVRSAALLATPSIAFPTPDMDNDTYEDAIDLVDGDAHLRVEVTSLEAPGTLPYLALGTQDDHWRLGAGRDLEWLHIVDPDPLGHAPGSPEWNDHALRTGSWQVSVPMEGAKKAMAPGGIVAAGPGIEWPQVFHLNVRDDAPATVRFELMDAAPDPDAVVGSWDVKVHADVSTPFSVSFANEAAKLDVLIEAHAGIPGKAKQEIANRWMPNYHFDDDERFYPTPGETLERFHGFARRDPADADHRTWTRDFNNARDVYTLLLADFNGDRVTDHEDVALMADVLRQGSGDRVYAHVFQAHGDRVVVQFWTFYMYNFVLDNTGRPVEELAHRGDREFIQLTFSNLDVALSGSPESIAYSQHYKGIRIDDPDLGLAPFHNSTHPDVYVASGSHASYPIAGDDRRLRGPLVGFGDAFDGLGETWTAEPALVDLLDRQSWAFGHLWGPVTRHHRDLGTAGKPLLQHDFRYVWHDPLDWERSLAVLEQGEMEDLYA